MTYPWILLVYFSVDFSVSQFTLYGFLKGNKPDFHVAMSPQDAKPFYESLVQKFKNTYNTDVIKGRLFWIPMNQLFLFFFHEV